MTNNTKQSEETYIRWSVNMNSAIEVGQIEPEPILTIHPDGRVTTSPRLKPDEVSALVLDQIKTAWLKDTQATKIREMQYRIKRLEDCAETAWGIIANVDSGSWQEQRADWREAATRWRDEQFHPELSERKAKETEFTSFWTRKRGKATK